MELASKIKLGVLVVAAILLVIIVVQNTQPVDTRLLFVTLTMPGAVLIFVTVTAGFVLGVLAGTRLARKNRKKPSKESRAT